MDTQVESNIRASNKIASSLKLKNELSKILDTNTSSILARTFTNKTKEEQQKIISILQQVAW